ncbi:MAG: 50S ribosomal protein L29 [bacterium]|nr:50S ribosomal protein L29 [bacterium]MDY4159639.1 50S ribosomal protein L29 [Candidatus Onthovivens sp.]
MKIKEVRELSTEELNNQVYSLKEQLFNLRRKKAVGNLDNMLELKRIRKDIARIYTVLRERELGMNKEGN